VILRRQGLCVSSLAWLAVCAMVAPATRAQRSAPAIELAAPIAVYLHEPVAGALSAAPPLSEVNALHDLDQLVRLKTSGLRVDFDLLDASAIAPDGLQPAGRTAAWPNGPDNWIARCRAAGIYPGLRFAASALRPGGPVPAPGGRAPAFFEKQFLPDFIAALQSWYDRGIRLFAFDGLALTTAPPRTATGLTKDQIVARNVAALRVALTAFRAKNRGAIILAIESDAAHSDASAKPSSGSDPSADNPSSNSIESRDETSRIGAFALLSTGQPRPSDRPQASLQRAIDIETDSQIRGDEQMSVPLAHILSTGFIAAPAGAAGPSASGLLRDLHREWKGEFVLSMARGGWVDTLSGSLDSVQTADARWMARVQKLFFEMQAQGQMHSFGGPPFGGQPYGFTGATSRGAVDVVVNPTQAVATLPLSDQPSGPGRLLFRDAGFSPQLTGNSITLGPGQMAAVGFGAYATPEFNFGVQQDVVIPRSIQPVDADFHLTAPGVLEARIDPPIEGVLRVVICENAPGGVRESVSGGGQPMVNSQAPAASHDHRLTLEITQGGRPIPLRPEGTGSDGESTLSAGLSWAVAEIDVNDLTPGVPLHVLFRSDEKSAVTLEGSAYQVIY
jgi:hypothetical protein